METEPHATEPLTGELSEAPSGQALVVVEPGRRPRFRRGRGRLLALAATILGAAALIFVAVGAWLRPIAVVVVHPARGDAVEAVYATGIVEAIDFARVGAVVAGRIVDLTVDEGDVVRQGQVLARLDERQARHRLEDARARLALAEEELKRDKALIDRGVRTMQALQRTQEERDRAAANVDLEQRQLEDYTIEAPLDGIVMKREVELGETVAANAVLFSVASTARLRIAADVDERDIAQVRMGAAMAVRAEGFPDQAFPAAVTNIRQQGDASSRTFRVEANLPADTKLMIGMTVDADIVTAERRDALLVPAAAVLHGPPQGGRPGPAYVFRIEDGRARRVPVQTGAVGPDRIEVVDGVSESDALINAPPDGLKAGQAVRAAP
jgi:RND family efflux transporter MFP subunit